MRRACVKEFTSSLEPEVLQRFGCVSIVVGGRAIVPPTGREISHCDPGGRTVTC
jgi:hypothetical protein